MPTIDYSPYGTFGAHYTTALQGRGSLTCTWGEILWAAITVGRAGWRDVFQHGRYSLHEITYRAYMILANIAESPSGHIVQSDAYGALDASEKSAVSYFVGMTMAKLFAHKLFDVAWLLHLDKYPHLRPVLRSQSRPDLLGLDRRRSWIVMEAKGRTNVAPNDLRSRAKDQTRNLRRIGGSYPSLRLALVTHFRDSELEVQMEDPPEFNRAAVNIRMDRNTFLIRYYELFNNLIGNNEKVVEVAFNEMPMHMFTIADVDLGVGITSSVFKSLKQIKRSANDDAGFQRLLASLPREVANGNRWDDSAKVLNGKIFQTSLGMDGIVVTLGETWRQFVTRVDTRPSI